MKRTVSLLFLIIPFLYVLATDSYFITVANDGTGDFGSIQEAINATKAFPPERITIFVKNGIYNEKVKVHAWNTHLTLIGESAENTIITYNDYFDKINMGRNSTFHTWTVLVEANDFIAENLTIANTAGQVGQAVALHVDADRCIFHNVRILGYQDALYAASSNSRQYYKDCYIEGTTDFIFGAATALFENCTINSKSNSYITAASTSQGVKYGFVFKQCRFTADDGIDNVFIGRPWREHAKTVIIECELGRHIAPEGWKAWSNANNLGTSYYAEYKNFGQGKELKNRVHWSHQLTKYEAKKYSKEKIFGTTKNKKETWWNIDNGF